jgi:hypothetical protein
MSTSNTQIRTLGILVAASLLHMVTTAAHATAFEPLAVAMASNRSNDFGAPPWKVLVGIPGVKWKLEPQKAMSKLQGVMSVDGSVDGVPKRLELSIGGAPVGFHRVDILGIIKHGVKDAGSTRLSFSPQLFGQSSVRRIFTTCDDDGVASRTEHYSVEYEGQRPIYVSFDASVGNRASYMTWRIHLTEAAMLSGTGPTCERQSP